jgi:intracellular sulfur oxidation DsrE/DsrF family protein
MKRKISRRMFFALFVLGLLVTLVSATAYAQSDKVKFTITNKSNKMFTLRMNGPEFLYLVVEPGTKKIFTPLRGEYTFTMFSCQAYANGNIDLTTIKNMVVPECGSAGPETKSSQKIDASDTIKLVKITIENDAPNSNMVVVMTGPGTFVFSLKTGQKQSYTIPRGEYSVKYYACNRSDTRMFNARANKVLELACPK